MAYREVLTGLTDRTVAGFQGNDSGNAPTLLMLGGFKFSLSTAAFQELNRTNDYRWPAQQRVGALDALQFTGPGEERITLPGIVFPDFRGGMGQVDDLRRLAAEGRPLRLISPTGQMLGEWVIDGIEETQTSFKVDGTPRKQEFILRIRRYSDADL